MTSPSSPGQRTHRPARWWVLAGALLLVALTCLGVGLRSHRHALVGPVGPQRPPPSALQSVPLAPPPVARSTPVALSIPAINLTVPLSKLGLNPDGTVQVPTNFAEPGWYQLGPAPGQIGSAVILGHVDSYQGPAVFFKLPTLVAGDQVDVSLADGDVAEFSVYTVVMYPKSAFPDALVYSSHGYSALQLVTCGGTFDSQTGHYLSNVVVYTTLVSITNPTVAAWPADLGWPAALSG